MRLLGQRATLDTIRFDLVFLLASISTDDRAGINSLAPEVDALIARFRNERAAMEAAQEAAVIATARRGRADDSVDRRVLTMGGVVRATNKALYDRLFPRLSPAKTTRLALAKEVEEVKRLEGELEKLDAADRMRAEYAEPLKGARLALEKAMHEADDVDVSLALARSALNTFKHDVDAARVRIHGKLQIVTGKTQEADEFFRAQTSTPEGDSDPAPAPPAPAPAPPPPA